MGHKAEDSDYYTPEDPEDETHTILSPVKSQAEKVSLKNNSIKNLINFFFLSLEGKSNSHLSR